MNENSLCLDFDMNTNDDENADIDFVEIVDLIDMLRNRVAKIDPSNSNDEFQLEYRMLLRNLKNFRKFL